MQSALDDTLDQARERLERPSLSSVDSIGLYVEELERNVKDIESAVESQDEATKTWAARVEILRHELRFHRLRHLKERLQFLFDQSYEALRSDLKDLGDYRDITGQLRTRLNDQLDDRLRQALPPIAQEMTEVYLRLTESPTFDSISIQHQRDTYDSSNRFRSMALDLRVSSSRGAGTWGVEDGILNGQALNAIQLVPYFVFSRYQEGPLLDLLLLDDPTQAFDTRKIELLLKELSEATSHATLLVATHEEDRFLPLLNQYFAPDETRAFRTVGLDEQGPRLEDVPITL